MLPRTKPLWIWPQNMSKVCQGMAHSKILPLNRIRSSIEKKAAWFTSKKSRQDWQLIRWSLIQPVRQFKYIQVKKIFSEKVITFLPSQNCIYSVLKCQISFWELGPRIMISSQLKFGSYFPKQKLVKIISTLCFELWNPMWGPKFWKVLVQGFPISYFYSDQNQAIFSY